jgi:hypothetical protein
VVWEDFPLFNKGYTKKAGRIFLGRRLQGKQGTEAVVHIFSFKSASEGRALPRWLKIMKSRFAGRDTIL